MSSELMNELTAFFARDEEEPNFQLVYMFGSRVSGHVGPRSDYDFAILFSKEPETGRVCSLKHRIAEFLATDRIDVVVLNRAPIELQYNVIATGRIVYEKTRTAFVEFETRTLCFYFDALPVLRRHRNELLEGRNREAGVHRYRTTLGKTQRLLAEIRAS